LKFRAKIGQKMSLKFNFKTDKIINSLKQAGAEWGQTKCKIWLAGSNKFKFFFSKHGPKSQIPQFEKKKLLQLKMGHKQQF